MNGYSTVSVVVPAFNVERTVGDTVRSLLALNYPRDGVDLIVVNNASTDRTAQVLAGFGDRVQVVHEPRRGRSSARNAGLRVARHDVVAFIDADCTAHPDWLRFLVPRLEDPDVGVAGGKIRAARPCNEVEEFGERLHDHARSICRLRPPYAITPNWASRRSLLVELGGFDESLPRGEDCDLSFRVLQAGLRIVYEERAVVDQRNRSNLPALFGEGFDDGLYSVKLLKKQAPYLSQFGYPRINRDQFRTLGRGLGRLLMRRASAEEKFQSVFTAGKIAGKLCGSLRYRRLEL